MANHPSCRLAILTLLAATACGDEPATAPASAPGPEMAFSGVPGASANGRYIVTFKGNRVPPDFGARVTALGGTMAKSHPVLGIAYADGLTEAQAASLARQWGVAEVMADPEIALELPSAPVQAEAVGGGVESILQPATAFFYARQWGLRAIGADQAWAAGRIGSPAVRVGILDTGLDYTHADLVGKVDLAASRSFVPFDNPFVNFYFPGQPNWIDLHYHGTHVGATVSSNALATAGVTSQVTLVAVKVLSVNGTSQGSSVLDGIMYAASPLGPDGAGVDVINLSLGSSFLRQEFAGFVSIVNRALNYAHQQGVTVVVSAGNSAIDLDHDGSSYKLYCNATHVICASATGPSAQGGVNGPFFNTDDVAAYSNFGRSAIDVGAPGGWGTLTAGTSFVYAACSRFSLQIPVCQTGTFVVGVQGTSQASPHVSGLAALLVEDLGRNPAAIGNAIRQGADDLGPPGTDPLYGKGRINVPASLGL
jgi:subtilisin family serine protease